MLQYRRATIITIDPVERNIDLFADQAGDKWNGNRASSIKHRQLYLVLIGDLGKQFES